MAVSKPETKIAAIFRDEVDRQSINQRLMADATNVSPQNLSHILNGRRTMGIDRLVDFADYLSDSDLDF